MVTSGPSTSTMPLLGQHLAQLAPALLLIAGQRRDRLADARELLGRRQPVRALGGDARAHLALEAGDADHEEFVEVVGRDRQEPHPLQQRMGSLAASSRTRRLKCSQDSSRLMKRSGLATARRRRSRRRRRAAGCGNFFFAEQWLGCGQP